MNDATIKSTVGIQMSPEGMAGAAKQFDAVLQKTIANLNKAAGTAERAVNSSAKAGQAATQQMNGQLKALAITLGQIKTLQGALTSIGAKGTINSAGLLGDFGATGNIGKQARAITDYRNSLRGASSAMTTLRDRVRQFDQQAGNLAKRGQTLSQGQIFKAEKINETAKAYSKVTNEIGNLRGRVALLGTDGQKAFKPMLDQLTALEKANAKAFSNRRRSNYQPEISATQKLVRNVRERLTAREKLEKATRLNIEALRQEGLQITRNTALEREAALAKSVRAANSRFNNLQLIGGTIRQRDTDQVSRFARASALAAANQNQLTAALNRPNTSARRIQALINRHKQLQREIGESISAQNRMQASAGKANKGGFFSGLNAGRKNAFQGEADGQGAAFGAGSLIGRVGSYALAAGAVYGLISAFQQGISFAIQFEDALAQLQAVSGSTSLEMERLSKEILSVSKNSANSVLELTKSATIIAQAGFAGSEISTLLDSVVNLAGASGSSTDEAVDILTSTLGAFQLEASEATRVTDGLVAALNDSKLSVNQVQLGLQYVGATARLNNITFNELVATLGTMADAGIRSGSTMSTGLRQMLVDFIDPSKKLVTQLNKVGLSTADIDVKTLGLVEVLTRLRNAGFQGYGALETRAAAAFAVLSANIPKIQELEQATLRQGVAAQAQEIRMSSLSAQWQSFLNRLSETGNEIGESLIPLFEKLMVLFGGLLLLIGDILSVIASLIGGITGLADGIFELNDAATDTSFSMDDLRAKMEEAGASTEAIEEATRNLADTEKDLQTALRDTEAEMDSLQTRKQSLQTEIQKLISRQDDLGDSQASVSNQVAILASRFPGLREEFNKTEGGISGLIVAMQNLDRQTAVTLANTARRMIAMQRMLKINAENRLRGITDESDDVFQEGTPFGLMPRSLHPTSESIFKFRDALSSGDFDSAEGMLGGKNAEAIMKALPDTVSAFNKALMDRDQADSTIQMYEDQLAGFEFSSSEIGANLQREVQAAVANSQRAASQGESNGLSKGEILGQLNNLTSRIDTLSGEYEGEQGIQAFLGSARASVQSATFSLAPNPAASGGGSSGGRKRGNTAAQRLQRQRDRDFKRNEALIQREELEYRKEFYDNQLRMLENAPTLDDIPDIMDSIDEGLTEYLNAESEAALAAILKNNPTEDQKTRLLETAARKAEQLRQENIEKIAGVLSQAISKFVETSTEAIERQFTEATRFAQRNVDKANAEVEGLQRPSLNSNVPNYFVTVKQRQAEVAQERLLRAQIPARDRQIADRQGVSDRANEEIRLLASELVELGKVKEEADLEGNSVIVVTGNVNDPDLKRFQDLVQSMREYDQETQDMIDANDDLKASFEVLNDVPTTLSEGMKTAFEAVRIEMNSSGDFMQDIIKGLDEPLLTARNSFATFFNEVLTGSTSVGQAIRNVISGILDSIVNMISQALANQAFLKLGELVGLDTGQQGGSSEAATATATAAVAQGATTIAQGAAAVAQGGATLATATGAVVTGAGTVATTAATTSTALAEILVTIGEAMAKVAEAAAQVAAAAAGSGGGGEGGSGLISGIASLFGGDSWRGGPVTGRGKYRGGEIMEGLKTRDSVLTPTAKGEYIVREAAVSSIGTDMLNSINAQGAAALKGVGGTSIAVTPAPVETNVYVVSPENKPSLGPNDVIAIVTNDVLKGGQTKKLIKKVANG